MALTPEGYRPRLVDPLVERYLRRFGAVVIEGPKWCGKTWTGLNHASSMVSLTDPAGDFAARTLALTDPAAILQPDAASMGLARPLLIDEWQEAPALWDAVRHGVDQTPAKGQFILTGSATPADHQVIHSGAGRMARLRMRTFSLFESGHSNGTCSVAGLFAGEPPVGALPNLTVAKIIDLALSGGWPAGMDDDGPNLDLPLQYLHTLAESDVPHVDGSRRDPRKVAALLRSLARNNATVVSQNTLVADIARSDRDPAVTRATLARYLDVLARLFVVEEIPAWSPTLRSRTRLRTSPKVLLTDPSLVIAALRASPQALLRDLRTLGFVFEGLCLRDLAVYCTAIGAELFHYQDSSGLEVDAIIEADDGAWGAIEIKLGAHQEDVAASHLLRLRDKMLAGSLPPPSFLAVITGTGATHLRPDGVVCAPISALRP
ncbi:MAG: DUF4143 domain-containing protein [Micrococcales bacterium]|nr:DUF4143 domain-containing protein [Micrococcales bacterium]